MKYLPWATRSKFLLSPPSRGRGLKFICEYPLDGDAIVAPLAGAWIEILAVGDKIEVPVVAPLAGAWIEIENYQTKGDSIEVAPLAGAWIEMSHQP